MKVLICGDRNWTTKGPIKRELAALKAKHGRDLLVIEGGCKGADLLARELAEEMNITVMEFPANWKYQRKAAGPIRNKAMLKWGQPDLVLAFHDDILHSRGTKDMVAKARASHIEHRVVCTVYKEEVA
jgi:hypothetical protein